MTDEADKGAPPRDSYAPWRPLLDPVVFIALLILLSIFFLIGSAIFGFDKGVLIGMGRIEFARGLITYLFAIVTIGTAVVLVVSALTGTEDEVHEKRFQRGKEILALLLGVFGTIVGFYFGSEISNKAGAPLSAAPLRLSERSVRPASSFTVETYISGGQSPYTYAIGFDKEVSDATDPVERSGWIDQTMAAPQVTNEKAIKVHLIILDSAGGRLDLYSTVAVEPEVVKSQ
jgi:hypothetical protein